MWGIYSSILAAFKRQRKCPNCGKINIIRIQDKDKTVKCSRCGTPIPPPGPTV